jgi:hypothetical protein
MKLLLLNESILLRKMFDIYANIYQNVSKCYTHTYKYMHIKMLVNVWMKAFEPNFSFAFSCFKEKIQTVWVQALK